MSEKCNNKNNLRGICQPISCPKNYRSFQDFAELCNDNPKVCAGCGQLKTVHKWFAVVLPHGLDRNQTKPFCKECYEKKVVEDAITQ